MCSGDDRTLRFTVTDDDRRPGRSDRRAGGALGLRAPAGERQLRAAGERRQDARRRRHRADAPGGVIEVAITGVDTSLLAKGRYHHELEMTDAAGAVSTLAMGVLTLIEDLLT